MGERARQKTVEWQVCGICNYDCSYCIQSKKSRVGHPSPDDIERFLAFFADLKSPWEIKMTGGEPFAFRGFMDRIVPGLITNTAHTLSVLTNLSAPLPILERFAELTRGRLGIVSASIHLEHVAIGSFVEKAAAFSRLMDPSARLVINAVLVPGRLDLVREAREAIEGAGLSFFPQVMKVGRGVIAYDEGDKPRVRSLLGRDPSPRTANVAPSYRGKLCYAGAEYFVLTQTGDAYRCRSAKRDNEGFLGNVLTGQVTLYEGPLPCTYDICPCTVPANRGMIEGVGVGAGASSSSKKDDARGAGAHPKEALWSGET